jgi:HD-GYP domain-containing protein (c-di-GMP phosphodiesterase class II)
VIAALSLVTDLGIGVELEHGLHSTLVAMRLAERLGVDARTASETYYACLLFHIGCTVDAEAAAEIFGGEVTEHVIPVLFGSQGEMLRGLLRALPTPGSAAPLRAAQAARRLPRAVKGYRRHLAAVCEVGLMLTDRLGLPAAVQRLFWHLSERWDGRGFPGRAARDEVPLSVRIVHVARDAIFQRTLGGDEHAAQTVRERGGGALDPAIARLLADEAVEFLAPAGDGSAWAAVLAREPAPHLVLEGEAIDRALAAMGDVADLVSPYLAGHSEGVAALAAAAGARCGCAPADVRDIRRAGLVHDLGRVAVSARVWQKGAALTAGEWERVRLHPYQSERVLSRSPALAGLAPVAGGHHERLDGSGYHRGATAASLPLTARLLAAADAYHAMTEPRPHRAALSREVAAEALGREGRSGRLDMGAVAAVLEAAGQPAPRMERPAGLTEREAEVVGLVARGLQTKQVARALSISPKTADRHIQNAYAKIGVSTRAAAALFAMEHGLTAWGELPMGGDALRS